MFTRDEMERASALAWHIRRALDMPHVSPVERDAQERLRDALWEVKHIVANFGKGGRQKDVRRQRAIVRLCENTRQHALSKAAIQTLMGVRNDAKDGYWREVTQRIDAYLGLSAAADTSTVGDVYAGEGV